LLLPNILQREFSKADSILQTSNAPSFVMGGPWCTPEWNGFPCDFTHVTQFTLLNPRQPSPSSRLSCAWSRVYMSSSQISLGGIVAAGNPDIFYAKVILGNSTQLLAVTYKMI
jgi:hypothetical protein